MASIRLSAILMIMLAIGQPCRAGILDHFKKKSNCDEACESGRPIDSRPAIERPCGEIVRTYQRGFATPPGGCDTCIPGECVPGSTPCWPSPGEGFNASCTGSDCDGTCDSDLAALIIDSRTNCHAVHRRAAVHKIGTHYSCASCCQVMPALVYALNDTDECVRAKAADKIGDQLRNNPSCCAGYVLCALKLSLGDCDQNVRIQAEQALVVCGYRIIDPQSNCSSACVTGACAPQIAAPASAAPVAPAAELPKISAAKTLLRKLSIAPAPPEELPPADEQFSSSPNTFSSNSARPLPGVQELAPIPQIQGSRQDSIRLQAHEISTAQASSIYAQPLTREVK